VQAEREGYYPSPAPGLSARPRHVPADRLAPVLPTTHPTTELLCGSYTCTPAHYRRTVDLIFTSPPYNIGSKSPRIDGKRKNGQYDPKSYGGITGYADSLPEDQYQDEQVAFLQWCLLMLKDDGVLVYNHKPRRQNMGMIHPMQWLLRVPQFQLMEEIIWDRGSTHNHANRLFWPQTERLYVFRKADGAYRFQNTADMEFRSDVWRIPLCSRQATDAGHACPFDGTLASSVINAFTAPGDLVCDPYSGSGTTMCAAQAMGRSFVGTEISKVYHRQSIERLQMQRMEVA
jgi:DNA modification methylase